MSIQARVLEALRWTTATRLASYLLTWSINLLVIRLLRPADYGRMALCMVWIGLADLLSSFGQRSALIQRRQLDLGVVRKVFGALLLWNVVLFVLLQQSAPRFAAFYEDPLLEPMIRIMALGVFVGSFATVPQALRWREIDFPAISVVEMVQSVSVSLTVLLLALRGFGVWALVAGQLVGTAVFTAGVLLVTGFRSRPDFRVGGLSGELRFGAWIVARSLVGYLDRQIDTVLIGKLLGSVPLGAYTVAGNVARQPSRALLQPITSVTFPTFARIQEQRDQVRRYYLGFVETIAFAFFPMLWGLGAVASDLVTVVMGARWHAAIPILEIMCLFLPFRSLMRVVPPMLDGLGRPDASLRHVGTVALCLPVGVAVGAQWGIVGAASGWAGAHGVAMLVNLRRALPLLGASFAELGAVLWRTALASGFMVAATLSARATVLAGLEAPWRLPAAVAVGAASYALATLLLNRVLARELLRRVRS